MSAKDVVNIILAWREGLMFRLYWREAILAEAELMPGYERFLS